MRKAKFGACRLTNHNGQFVRCHLLPQALTRPKHSKGRRFIEAGVGDRAIGCRWNSCYDDELVCAEGEACLEKYDDKEVPYVPQFKFYMDGLAVLIFSSLNELPPGLGDMIVGVESHLLVSTMEFEHSEQFANLLLAVREAHTQGIA
jgi:hypothetical protein